jgi:uncharacterized protein with PQ loop repeat
LHGVLQIGYAVSIQWWLVFLPQWIGHAGHLVLVVFVLISVVSSQLSRVCWPTYCLLSNNAARQRFQPIDQSIKACGIAQPSLFPALASLLMCAAVMLLLCAGQAG